MKKLSSMLKEVRIMGSDCKIKYEVDLDRGQNFGLFDPANNQIHIADNNTITEQQKLATVLHEIIEGLNFKLELNLEHHVITSLENGLFQVLMDNPDLIIAVLEYY